MLKRALLSLVIVVGAACALCQSSVAQQPYGRDDYGPDVLPLDRVLPTVRQGRPGQFFDAEGPFPDSMGGYHYRIKWLTPDGRIIWLDADARSGRVLGIARGDWRAQGPPRVGPYNGGPSEGPEGGRPEGNGGPPEGRYRGGPPVNMGGRGPGGGHYDHGHGHGGR